MFLYCTYIFFAILLLLSDMCNISGPNILFDDNNSTCIEINPSIRSEEMIWVATATQECIGTNRMMLFDVIIGRNQECAKLNNIFYTRLNNSLCSKSIRLIPCVVNVSVNREPMCRLECSCPEQGSSCEIYLFKNEIHDSHIYHICSILHGVQLVN